MKKKLMSAALLFLVSLCQGFDMEQFGLILGGSYSTLGGSDANNMAIYVDGVQFDDGRQPFGYTKDTKQDPSGAFGPVAGAFVRFDISDMFYSRFELYYLWKGGEYQKSIAAEETYYGGPNGENRLDSVASIKARLLLEGEGEILDGMRRWVISTSYLELPILLGLNISREFSVYAGPHISYLLDNSFEAHVTESDSYMDEELIEGKKSYTNVKLKTAIWDVGFTIGVGYIFTDEFQLALKYAPGFSKMLDRSNAPDISQNTLQLVACLNFSQF